MIAFYRKHRILAATFLIIIIALIFKIFIEKKPYAEVDAIEYSLMTEAFFNHMTPNVENEDCESFKQAFLKANKWEENDKAQAYDGTQGFIKNNNLKLLDFEYAFFVDTEGKKHSVHFFFYSLLNLPLRWLCSIFPFNPLHIFPITNILLVLISCFLFLKYPLFEKKYTAGFVLLFFFSTNYWYLFWEHPEVFTTCFVSLGLWFFFQNKQYLGILCVSIAALQNQPLAILSVVLSFLTLLENGFNFKNIIKIGLSSFLILLPAIFYYSHYGETNLIKYQGALSLDYVTTTRVFGFFFDINQGVILAIPFILPAYILFLTQKKIIFKNDKIFWNIIIPFSVIMITCIAGTIDNWNHGQAVVNRYVTYLSAVIIVHFFYLLMHVEKNKTRNIILFIAVFSQLLTVFYHQRLSQFDWSTNQPKPIANWILEHYPKLYNPDPIIFIARHTPGGLEKIAQSPAYYINKNGEITKFLVHEKHLQNLEQFGISKNKIDSIAPLLKYINKWAYINVNENFHSSFSLDEIKNINSERRLARQIKIIRNDAAWHQLIIQKAKDLNITEEESLRNDAAYILGIELVTIAETVENKIQLKIDLIKATPAWLKLIEEKALEQNITLENALLNDARWMVEQEGK